MLSDPTSHYELLLPWVPDSSSGDLHNGQAISRERNRWRSFRQWQLSTRGIAVNEGFEKYLEEKRQDYKAMKAFELTEDPEFEETIRCRWEIERGIRQTEKSGSNTEIFSAHTEMTKRRLADYGFTQPLQFESDPKQQNQWTNWAEYLEFESQRLERLTKAVQKLQPQYSIAWETLKAAKVLTKTEKEEDLILTGAEHSQNTGAKSIPSILSSARESSISVQQQLTSTRKRSRVSRGTRKSADAKGLHDTTRRNEAISKFMRSTEKYREAQAKEQGQRAKVKWVLQQLKEIEPTGIPLPKEGNPKSTRGTKRVWQEDERTLLQPKAKKKKEKYDGDKMVGAS